MNDSVKRIVIVDGNIDWCAALAKSLGAQSEFNVVGVVHDGMEAIRAIEADRPDVIILDLILPIYDGYYLIDYVRSKMGIYHPFLYVLSALGADRVAQFTNTLDLDFYSAKPIIPEAIGSNLSRLLKHGAPSAPPPTVTHTLSRLLVDPVIDLSREIKDYLFQVGASLSLTSTRNVLTAIRLCLEDETTMNSIMGLYRSVAEIEGTTPTAVERNIRSVTMKVQRQNTEFFQQCFPYSNRKLGGAEFVATSAHLLKKRLEDAYGIGALRRAAVAQSADPDRQGRTIPPTSAISDTQPFASGEN